MTNYTKLDDTLSGSEGKGFITRGGQNREMFEIYKNRCTCHSVCYREKTSWPPHEAA
mgnify:CR=1 FL=1